MLGLRVKPPSRRRRFGVPGAAVALFAASYVVSGFSQTQPAPQPPQPTFRTEANYVRVDVYPTNKDGTPVTDLRQDEFEIIEASAPQTIEQFERVLIQGNLPQEIRREPNSVEA